MTMNQTPQAWASVEIILPEEQEDLASWIFMQNGAIGCEIHILQDGNVSIKASFNEDDLNETAMRSIEAGLEEHGMEAALDSLKLVQIPHEDWLAKWKEGYEPFRVGTKFVICPAWMQDTLTKDMTDGREVLLIEPGMAFGTGLHATTQYCLRALESYPPPNTILDVGTGSGILAMACAKLNPKAKIVGIDTDPVAIDIARKDLQLNGCEQIELVVGSTETVMGSKFDLLLSNLTCEDIISLLGDYVKLLNKKGRVICAGILKERFPLLDKEIKKYPLIMEQTEFLGNWVGVVLQKQK